MRLRQTKHRQAIYISVLLLALMIIVALPTAQLPRVYATGITRVQYARGYQSSSAVIQANMGATPTNGNTEILTYSGMYRSITSISQTGVTWTVVITKSSAGGGAVTEIWMGIVGAGADTWINAYLSGTSNNQVVINVCEYSGGTFGVDKTATNLGTTETTTDTGTTATTTYDTELWVGSTAAYSGTNPTQVNATNGFTLLDGGTVPDTGYPSGNAYLEKIVSSTGTANSGTAVTQAPTEWAGAIATFALIVSVSMTINTSGLGTGYYATLTYYNNSNTLTTRHLSATGGNSSITDTMYIGSSLTISGLVTGVANQRWITTDTTTKTIPSTGTTWTFTYRKQWKPTITLTGTTVSLTVSITARTANGTSATASGLYTSWSNWCDDSTTLTFGTTNSGGGSASERLHTVSTVSWSVTSALVETITYIHQWKPTITLTGTTSGLTVSITARTLDGSDGSASGLYTSWSDWCDDSTTLTFSTLNTGGGSGTERLHTVSTVSWSVTSALAQTITYLHQWKPTITLTGTTAALTVSITARTLDGSPATASGLFTSWSDWCDDSTTLTFSTLNTGGGSGTERLHTVSTVSWSVTSALTQTITYIHEWEPTINTTGLPNSANYVTVSYTLDGSAKSQVVSGQGGNSSWTDWADASTNLSIGQTLTLSGTERYHTADTVSWTVSDATVKSDTYRHQWKPTVTPTGLPNAHPTNVTRTVDGSSGSVTGISSTSPFNDWVDTSTTLSIADPITVSTYQRWKNSNATNSYTVTSAASQVFIYVDQTEFVWSFKASDGITDIASSIQRLNVTDPSAVAKVFVTGNFTGLWVSNGTWTVTGLRYGDDAGGFSNILVSQTPYSTGGARSITSKIYDVTLNGLDQSANALNGNTTISITYPSGSSKSYTSLTGTVSRGYTMPNGTYALTVYWNGIIVNSTLTSHSVTADESLNISALVYYTVIGSYRMAVDQGTISDVNAGASSLQFNATAIGSHTIVIYVGSLGIPSALTIDGTVAYAGTGWFYVDTTKLISIPLSFSSHQIWMNWAGTPPSGPSGGTGGTTPTTPTGPIEQVKEAIVAVTKTPWLIGLLVPLFLFCGAYYGYREDKRWLALTLAGVSAVWLVNLLFFTDILPGAELSKATYGYFPIAVPYVGLPTLSTQEILTSIMAGVLLLLPIILLTWYFTRE